MTEPERYLVLIEGGPPSNYSAWSPDLLGCVSAGDTIEQCVSEMREAIAGHLEVMLVKEWRVTGRREARQ